MDLNKILAIISIGLGIIGPIYFILGSIYNNNGYLTIAFESMACAWFMLACAIKA